ncbi:unnamed protein product [Arctogadus glacialis]
MLTPVWCETLDLLCPLGSRDAGNQKNGDSQTKLSLSLSGVERRLSVSPPSRGGVKGWRRGGGVKRLIVSGSLLFVEVPPPRLGTTGFCQTTALRERSETRASVSPPLGFLCGRRDSTSGPGGLSTCSH